MALSILVDNFSGNPERFYELTINYIEQMQIPDIVFMKGAELGRKKGRFLLIFEKREVWSSLIVKDKINTVVIVAFNYGNNFVVNTRSFWNSLKYAGNERECSLLLNYICMIFLEGWAN